MFVVFVFLYFCSECVRLYPLKEAKAHMKRCIDSGLWVPNSKTDDGDEKDEEGTYEEVKAEQEEAKKE